MSLVIFGISSCLKDLQRVREQEETPVESALIQNTYDWSKLVKDGDRMSYEDDQYTSMQGIDVSSHQEWIDWEK